MRNRAGGRRRFAGFLLRGLVDVLPPWFREPAASSEPGVFLPQLTRSVLGQQVGGVNGAETGSAFRAASMGTRSPMEGSARMAVVSHDVEFACQVAPSSVGGPSFRVVLGGMISRRPRRKRRRSLGRDGSYGTRFHRT